MIPKQVKVAGLNYVVEEKPYVGINNNKNFLGACDYDQTTIEILENISDERKEEVFVHELTHAIFEAAGYDEQDEEMINRLGKVLNQVLKDNPNMLSERKSPPELETGGETVKAIQKSLLEAERKEARIKGMR
ncbi:ImmA/IrrE family metallo-endopeptidase [Sediminibacillus massiliensis]|uniref:ImmA/IrrE family metallo-endopeptidase n=1 Tax=Sediminibacillus massiliensis TaxID=1926277 RepID=UPI0015C3544E|nr:ImmA/IrrE family metallo-endopeptidase [Sediminibacillus massiliensis]